MISIPKTNTCVKAHMERKSYHSVLNWKSVCAKVNKKRMSLSMNGKSWWLSKPAPISDHMGGRGCLCGCRGTESPTSFPTGPRLPGTVCLLLGTVRTRCVTGGGLWEACTGFPPTPLCAFPLYWCCFVQFPCNKSWSWVGLYTESSGSC